MTDAFTLLTLAVIQGLALAVLHFAFLCFAESRARAAEQFAYLLSGYSLVAYIMIIALSTYGDHYILDRPVANLWFVRISRFASSAFHQNLQNAILGIQHAMETFAPQIGTAWSSSWDSMLRCFSIHSIITRANDFKLSMLYYALHNTISFLTQPHVIDLAQQISAIVLVAWFLIAQVESSIGSPSKQATSNGAYSTHAGYACHEGDEEAQIYWLVREIAANCNNHWRKYFLRGCKLVKGASMEQINKLEEILYTNLPNDFRIFLKNTNGLENVLDGSCDPLTFASTDSDSWVSEMCCAQEGMQDLWIVYLVEALFGPGTHGELIEQTGLNYICPYQLGFIRIASHGLGSTGLFLVPPDDFRKVMQFWFPVAHDNVARNGSIIGRIHAHEQAHFGRIYHPLEALEDRNDWMLLQVQRVEKQTYCRLYPSLTAYLQTLAELTRRRTSDLMTPNIDESCFAQSCRLKWEVEWTERALYEGGY
ncbi:hypothetical protein F4861DRAFT_335992 [Xylaria intraflava]|nr:hypothetical protein F4861DRAFT_335992 [Xylaria intraflava]